MTKQEKSNQFKKLHGTFKMTFKFPIVATSKDEGKLPLTVRDLDFVETEALRQFFINMQRAVDFEFVAYPEDRACDDARKFVGLHYHAVARTQNDKKFMAVAPKKYDAVLRSRFELLGLPFTMRNESLYNEPIYLDSTTSYEDYCLKQYDPSKHIVTDADYRQKRPLRSPA